MNLIRKCRYKAPFDCCYVTNENIFDFLKTVYPDYNSSDYTVDITGMFVHIKINKRNYPYTFYYLDRWYIKDECGYWEVCESFDEDFEIIES